LQFLSDSILLGHFEQNGRGCGYVEWHDAPLPKFWSDLLGDLRDEVWRLRTEEPLAHMPEEGGRRDSLLQALQDELKLKNDEIKVKNAEIAILKKTVLLVFSVFVLGLVAGKLLMQ
jgi:hypothetical protein